MGKKGEVYKSPKTGKERHKVNAWQLFQEMEDQILSFS